jgi:2-amino-4-hydroxy-6-hydroxymethyldihydropteridine diphosphokinase
MRKRTKRPSQPPSSPASPTAFAIVALGSNLGDSRHNVLRAMDRLQALSDQPLLRSSLWQTTPVDCPEGSPDFINAVVALVPREGESPESLLAHLQALEKEFGRLPKKVVNEARPLDLDLIAFRQEVRSTSQLTLPHPRAHQRRFVLQPLSEIAPNLVPPGQTKTIVQLLGQLPTDPGLIQIDPLPVASIRPRARRKAQKAKS